MLPLLVLFFAGSPEVSTPPPFAVEDETAFEQIDPTILELKQTLAKTPKGNEQARLLWQLGEIYWWKESHLHMRAVVEFNRNFDAWLQLTGGHASAPAPEPMFHESAEWRATATTAVENYEALLHRYPEYEHADCALYFLGICYLDLARDTEGVATLERLFDKYPDSDFTCMAYAFLAEYYKDDESKSGQYRRWASDPSCSGPSNGYSIPSFPVGDFPERRSH